MFTTLSSAIEFVRENKVKALAVTTRERMTDLPDIPTMYELGWKNLVTSSWQGVLVPTGTPRPIVDMLHAAIAKVLADPEIRARMRKGGAIAHTQTADARRIHAASLSVPRKKGWETYMRGTACYGRLLATCQARCGLAN